MLNLNTYTWKFWQVQSCAMCTVVSVSQIEQFRTLILANFDRHLC
jgi:hypothetical protein